MSLDSCHESRLMKFNFHKKQFYKGFRDLNFMILHKTAETHCFFVEYESRLIQYFIELVFMSHESRLM